MTLFVIQNYSLTAQKQLILTIQKKKIIHF